MKRILVAVDITPMAPLIVRHAVELARTMDAKLRLMHTVVVGPQVPQPGIVMPPAALRVQEFAATAERFLRELEDSIPSEYRDGVVVEIGSPSDRVCAQSRSYDPDVVVIGAHEYGLMSRALGTTASRIVNRADRPVFVVRPMPATHVAAEPAASHTG